MTGCESGPLRTVHFSRHKWPRRGHLLSSQGGGVPEARGDARVVGVPAVEHHRRVVEPVQENHLVEASRFGVCAAVPRRARI